VGGGGGGGGGGGYVELKFGLELRSAKWKFCV